MVMKNNDIKSIIAKSNNNNTNTNSMRINAYVMQQTH